jgi:hypothetical protein
VSWSARAAGAKAANEAPIAMAAAKTRAERDRGMRTM